MVGRKEGRTEMSDTIRRVAEKTKNFTYMVNEIFQRPELSWRAKGLYAYLMTLPNDWVIRKADLQNRSTEGREAMERAFNELMRAGYITREIIKEKGKFAAYNYTVYESTANGFPVSGFPSTVLPVTEKPQLLITNPIPKTKEQNDIAPSGNVCDKSRQPFQKPTLDEVRTYCQERKNTVNPEQWFDHYESVGWKIGKVTMKNWQAAVRTWERNQYNKPAEKTETIRHCKKCKAVIPGSMSYCPDCGQDAHARAS